MDSQDKDVKLFKKKDFNNGKRPVQEDRARWKNPNLLSSLDFALSGIWTAFKEERNMRKHALAAFLAIVFGLVFQISEFEWLFLLLSIFLVFMAEIFNSAIENVVDLASHYHFSMLAKKAKDMAAGAVLVVSLLAAVIGALIFIPRIWDILF